MAKRVILRNDQKEEIYPKTSTTNIVNGNETLDVSLKKLTSNENIPSISKSVKIADWTSNTDKSIDALYQCTVEHNMGIQDVDVTLLDSTGGITGVKQIVYKQNSFIMYFNSKVNLDILISNPKFVITTEYIDKLWNNL